MSLRPLVLVVSCTKTVNRNHYYTGQKKYVDAVLTAGDCMPLILPALKDLVDFDAVLNAVDGVMLTGAESNIDPGLYGQTNQTPDVEQDVTRDQTDMLLLEQVIKRKLPLFGICRGLQELNIFMGGTLHQKVYEVPGKMEHRDNDDDPIDVQYGPAHAVHFSDEGELRKILNKESIMVNSLHGQGLAQLGKGLRVEATAPDGLIEAVSIIDAPFLSLAVQWHPEWKVLENPDSVKIFKAFGNACRAHQEYRLRGR